MNSRLERLTLAYNAVLGRRLRRVIWMPLSCDTIDLVKAFEQPGFSYSGAVRLIFGPEEELFLTWAHHAPMTLIASTEAECWSPNTLDRISASTTSPWSDVIGATLNSVDLYLASPSYLPVAACHTLTLHGGSRHQFWVGTGYGATLGEGDELWIGLDQDPDDLRTLTLLKTLRLTPGPGSIPRTSG